MKTVCLILSGMTFMSGVMGMALSFFQLALSMGSMEDVVAGGTGFVAGTVLVGSGLISMAILCTREPVTWREVADDFRRSTSAFRRHAGPEE